MTRRARRRGGGCRSRSDQDFDLSLRPQPLDEGLGLLLAIPLEKKLLEPRLHFIERHRSRHLLLGHLDDVESKLGFDEIAHRAWRQAARGVVEGPDHLPLLKEAEIAAVGCAARIL